MKLWQGFLGLFRSVQERRLEEQLTNASFLYLKYEKLSDLREKLVESLERQSDTKDTLITNLKEQLESLRNINPDLTKQHAKVQAMCNQFDIEKQTLDRQLSKTKGELTAVYGERTVALEARQKMAIKRDAAIQELDVVMKENTKLGTERDAALAAVSKLEGLSLMASSGGAKEAVDKRDTDWHHQLNNALLSKD